MSTEKKPNDDQRLWESIPFELRVEIDMAIGEGKKIEAINRCKWASKDLALVTAKRLVEQRAKALAKRDIPKE